jgi:CBS-domain-containing membrane protein
MNAADIMTRSVVSVDPGLPVSEVARLMLSRGISAVPVVEPGGRIIGMISEGDLMRRTELGTERHRSWWLRVIADKATLAEEFTKSHARKARDIMTHDVVSVSEKTPAAEIVDVLEQHHIKRVPVVRDGTMVGIVSRANLLRAFASMSFEPPDVSSDDEAIRQRLVSELRRQSWWTGDEKDIIVTDGVVHLWGMVESQKERDAIRVAAESAPGVRSVKNHVSIRPPPPLYV